MVSYFSMNGPAFASPPRKPLQIHTRELWHGRCKCLFQTPGKGVATTMKVTDKTMAGQLDLETLLPLQPRPDRTIRNYVLILDDDRMVRGRLAAVLEYEVFAAARDRRRRVPHQSPKPDLNYES